MNLFRILRPAMAALLGALAFAGTLLAANPEPWALARVPVACVREKPGHASELGTQVVLGTPLQVVGVAEDADWLQVATPEGYKGYVISNSLTMKSLLDFKRWSSRSRVVVTSIDQTYIYTSPQEDIRSRLSEAVNGSVLLDGGVVPSGEWREVELPDGRRGFIRDSHVCPLDEWASGDFSLEGALDIAFSMMGSPYLWGGTSSKSVDCSGLTKVAFFSQGVILPRNASQQARIGMPLDINRPDRFSPGDLLFFGNRRTRRVNHVGIYIGEGKFIHCSGRVRVNSLDPHADDYMKLYLISASRLSADDLNRMSVANSGFYFPAE